MADDDDDDTRYRRELMQDHTATTLRDRIMREAVLPWAKARFSAHPTVRSILIGVSQYWADEADDAVHVETVLSTAETPRWPHQCYWQEEPQLRPAGYDDFCPRCDGHSKEYLSWDDNGRAIPAFEMFCHEEGSQEEDSNRNALPYAVLRRGRDGDIEVELIGRVVRGWLDTDDTVPESSATPGDDDERVMALRHTVYDHLDDDGPRHVLADELQHRGDPLGEYLALALHAAPTAAMRARATTLLHAYRRRWMGELLRVAPESGCQFARGFPVAVAAQCGRDLGVATTAFEWRTVESLRILPGCNKQWLPLAPGLRELGPIGAAQLAMLGRQKQPRLERLELELESDEMLTTLARLELPSLRSLILSGTKMTPQALARLARAGRTLDELEVRTDDAALIAAFLEAPARPRRLSFCRAAFGWPTGFRLTHDAGDAGALHMELVMLDRDATVAALGALIGALPRRLGERVVVHGSRRWTPLPYELEALRALARREIGVV